MKLKRLLPLVLSPTALFAGSVLTEQLTPAVPISAAEINDILCTNKESRVEVYKVRLNDNEKVNVEVKIAGNMNTGKSLVFLHGAAMCYGGMEFMTPYFPDYKHIYINAPGRGKSDKVINPSSYRYSNIYRAVLEKLLYKMEIVTIEALIGYSMGGFDALILGIERSKRKCMLPIKRLVILNSTGQLSETDPIYQAAMALTPENYDINDIFAIAFGSQTPTAYRKKVVAEFPMLNNTPPASAVTDLQITVTTKLNEYLKNMYLPTMFIGCKEDIIVPLERTMATSLIVPNSKLIVYEGAGHLDLMRLMDGESGYAAAINSFLKKKSL